jgi:hypothetical protein
MGWLTGMACLAAVISPAEAQISQLLGGGASTPPSPSISSIEPPGATIGGTTEWNVTGQNLQGITRWLFSGEGIEITGFEAKSPTEAVVKVAVSPGTVEGFREVRALSPGGLSNLCLFRLDSLSQASESEPNDDREHANEAAIGTAIGGRLKPRDLDHFRIRGRRGARIILDLEARRIGTPITPVVSVLGPSGLALAQAMETRGTDHDARLTFTFPDDGEYVVQVRDNLYNGSDAAIYRLRLLEGARYADGLYPLGGRAGETIEVRASGGNLEQPRVKMVTLPDQPGVVFDPGPFDGAGGPASVPMRMLVGGGAEVSEVGPTSGGSATPIEIGQVANGRIEAPGELDRYVLKVKKGNSIRVRIRAAELGSWLDSVVKIVDAKGKTVAENDDAGVNANNNQFQPFNNQPSASPDSRLTFSAREDGEVTIEVFDRYGEGGTEYAYRMEVGPARPDFNVTVLFGDPNLANRRRAIGQRQAPRTPGASGSLNLLPGSSTTLNFLVSGEGPVGPIEVHVEGLPSGVTSEPVKVSPPAFLSPNAPLPAMGNAIVLKAAPNASAELGMLRIVAKARPKDSPELVRLATATVILDTPIGGEAVTRPIGRELTEIPVWVVGDARPAALRPDFVGPPKPIAIALKGVTNPGVLLQGGRLDLGLELDPASPPPGSFNLEAEGQEGKGLSIQTLVTETPSAGAGGPMPGPVAVVRVVADTDAPTGEATVMIRLTPFGKPVSMRTERVEVRPPIAIRPREEVVAIAPGRPTTLHVEVKRETGVGDREPVSLRLDLPPGVVVTDAVALKVPPDRGEAEISLMLEESAQGPLASVPVDITGTIRMPRGVVEVSSAVRPMLSRRPAEE